MSNGGPAFPIVGQWYGDKLGGQLGHGMTLRDYFAAKAMQGDWSACNAGDGDDDFLSDACRYYEMADAMLKVREA